MEGNSLRSLEWPGWSDRRFCIEVQMPWSELMLERKKTIEVRSYVLPKALLGRKIYILQSPCNESSASKIGDQIDLCRVGDVDADDSSSHVKLVGWCIFNKIIDFHSESAFYAASDQHLVTPDSIFRWKNGITNCLYGWEVEQVGRDIPSEESFLAVRRLRSLFELQLPK